MSKEYEVVAHTQLKNVTAFLVRLEERMTHVHRDLEIGYLIDGSVILKTAEGSVSLTKGDVYLINSMEPHEFISEGKGVLRTAIQFSPRFRENIFSNASHYFYRGNSNLRLALKDSKKQFDAICGLCIELAYSYFAKADDYEYRCMSIASSLLYLLHKNMDWELMDQTAYLPLKETTNRLMAITDYIDRNFQRKLLLREIAENEGLSLTYLSHLFKDGLGMTFQDYLNQKRFEYASHLLFTTDWSTLDISVTSWFSDVRYFNEAFLRQYGCTPKQYRMGAKISIHKSRMLSGNTKYIFPPEDSLLMLSPLRADYFKEY